MFAAEIVLQPSPVGHFVGAGMAQVVGSGEFVCVRAVWEHQTHTIMKLTPKEARRFAEYLLTAADAAFKEVVG